MALKTSNASGWRITPTSSGSSSSAAAPWHLATDVALPCATQNELDAEDAAQLIANGVQLVAEGPTCPPAPPPSASSTKQRCCSPGQGGQRRRVATSGLEMSQNAQRLSWTREEVDARLKGIMTSIHATCVRYGQDDDHVNYESGANIAGFVKVADAMLAQGSAERPGLGFTLNTTAAPGLPLCLCLARLHTLFTQA